MQSYTFLGLFYRIARAIGNIRQTAADPTQLKSPFLASNSSLLHRSNQQDIPTFLDTLRVVLEEMHVEKALVSEEVKKVSPQIYAAICAQLGDVPVETIPHDDFKSLTASAKAIVRTGEYTPYANVILVSGAWGFGL